MSVPELPKLIVLRGNSGSGKSTIARTLCEIFRTFAWIEQDYFRRTILREDGGVTVPKCVGLIDGAVRYSLDSGYNVVLDGILDAKRHQTMLQRLYDDFAGRVAFYRFVVPFEETVRRHATRPIAGEFDAATMRSWYVDDDGLDFVDERIIHAESSLDQTVGRIAGENSLI